MYKLYMEIYGNLKSMLKSHLTIDRVRFFFTAARKNAQRQPFLLIHILRMMVKFFFSFKCDAVDHLPFNHDDNSFMEFNCVCWIIMMCVYFPMCVNPKWMRAFFALFINMSLICYNVSSNSCLYYIDNYADQQRNHIKSTFMYTKWNWIDMLNACTFYTYIP